MPVGLAGRSIAVIDFRFIPSLPHSFLLNIFKFSPFTFTMKTGSFLSLLAAPLAVDAHYIFNLVTNKGQTVGGEYAYARKNTNSYQPSYAKDIVNSPDLRCNQGAKPGNTGTYTVKAGDTIGFKLFFNEKIEHPGPGFVYVSKAPGKVADYDGSGEWTKVVELGLTNPSTPGVDTAWATWQKDQIEWTIQEQIPKGEYLVRVEHIAIHEGHVGKAQCKSICPYITLAWVC